MKTYMTAKKKKKKLYRHNFFLSSWPSNMGCWVLGRRVFEGSCAAQILWRFYDLLGRIYNTQYYQFGDIILDIRSYWVEWEVILQHTLKKKRLISVQIIRELVCFWDSFCSYDLKKISFFKNIIKCD